MRSCLFPASSRGLLLATALCVSTNLLGGEAAGARAQQPSPPQVSTPQVEELRRQASLGRASAQFLLGRRYQRGQGVPQSDEEAVKWFQRAAEQGHAPSQLVLAISY